MTIRPFKLKPLQNSNVEPQKYARPLRRRAAVTLRNLEVPVGKFLLGLVAFYLIVGTISASYAAYSAIKVSSGSIRDLFSRKAIRALFRVFSRWPKYLKARIDDITGIKRKYLG